MANRPSLPSGTVRLLALHAFDNAAPEDYIAWGEAALVEGLDTPTLRILAGLETQTSPSVFEVRPFFARVLAELGVSLPTPEAIAREYVDELVEDILAGRREPVEAVHLIHHVAIAPLLHPSDLQPWCDLGDGLDPDSRVPIGEANVPQRILEFAEGWMRRRRNVPGGAA